MPYLEKKKKEEEFSFQSRSEGPLAPAWASAAIPEQAV